MKKKFFAENDKILLFVLGAGAFFGGCKRAEDDGAGVNAPGQERRWINSSLLLK